MITADFDCAIGTEEVGPTVGVRSTISSPTAEGPVTASVRAAVAINAVLAASVEALVRGQVDGDLVSVDCVVADEAGWVKLPRPDGEWTVLNRPED